MFTISGIKLTEATNRILFNQTDKNASKKLTKVHFVVFMPGVILLGTHNQNILLTESAPGNVWKQNGSFFFPINTS